MKKILVTGADGFIGSHLCEALVGRGFGVRAFVYYNSFGHWGCLDDAESAIQDALDIFAGDIRDLSEELADRTMERFGRIDIWVNNAMVTVLSPVAQMSAEEYRRVTEVTYLGTVHGTLAALKHMRARNRGTIVQVGSALAYRAIPLQSAYCAAKFACRGFTDSLRVELLHEGSAIHLTTVHLSAFNTPQFDWARNRLPNRAQPVPPIFQPEVAAEGIVWAAGQRRREVCVGFPAVKTIWGNKLAPWAADWVLKQQGYDGQQTDSPMPDRQDNLFEPVDRDMGSHGRFDHQARRTSAQLWATMHRGALAAAAMLPVLLLVALRKR